MAQLATVSPGQAAEALWANTIRDQTIQNFLNTAAVNAAIPAPKEGQVVYVEDVDQLWVRSKGAWRMVAFHTAVIGSGMMIGGITIGGTPVGAQGGKITFAAAPSTSATPWAIDVAAGMLRFYPDGSDKARAVEMSTTQVAVLKTLLANSGLTVRNSQVDIRVPGRALLESTGDHAQIKALNGARHVYIEAGSHVLMSGRQEIRMIVAGDSKQIRGITEANWQMFSFHKSGGSTDFNCPIPALGGGTTVTIQGHNQFGRATSSQRYKIDIEDLPAELPLKLLDLRPVTFHDNPETLPNATTQLRVGLIAEEVAEIAPEYVEWSLTPDCDCVIPENMLAVEEIHNENGDVVVEGRAADPMLYSMDGPHHCWRPSTSTTPSCAFLCSLSLVTRPPDSMPSKPDSVRLRLEPRIAPAGLSHAELQSTLGRGWQVRLTMKVEDTDGWATVR